MALEEASLARDAAVPKSKGSARLVLRTGDVVYMTGEHRLYESAGMQVVSRFDVYEKELA